MGIKAELPSLRSKSLANLGQLNAVPKERTDYFGREKTAHSASNKMTYGHLLLLAALVAACTAITVPVQSQTSKGKALAGIGVEWH